MGRNVQTESTGTVLSDLDLDHLLSPVLQHYVFALLLFGSVGLAWCIKAVYQERFVP